MPYRKVIFRAGEYYHLYNRGNNFQPIFFEHENYFYFLRLIRKHLVERNQVSLRNLVSESGGLDVIAYCLMPNHYHLLVCLKIDDLPALMQSFTLAYSKSINKRFERVGSLFQGPFKAIHIDRDEYLLHLSRYIHLNPVAAGLVRCPEDWEFSSHGEYIGLRQGTLPKPQIVLDQFSSPEAYRQFVETYDANDQKPIEPLMLD